MEQIHLMTRLPQEKRTADSWCDCGRNAFEADEPYLQVYREQMLVKSDARTVALREQGKILGMLTLLPCSYRGGRAATAGDVSVCRRNSARGTGQAGGDPDAFVGGPLFAAAGDRGGYSCTGYRVSVQLLPQARV